MMGYTRRQFAVAGVLTLGTTSLLLPGSRSMAESSDEASVAEAGEALRMAMVNPNRARLDDLPADQLSYGHSSGVIQTKAQFIDVIVSQETIYKSITLSESTTMIVGDNAIVRHVFSTDFESGGKPGSSRIGALQVWQKQANRWKLLARQGFKI